MTTLCDVCDEPLDEARLRTGPLKRVCLECLSADERRALEHDLAVAASVQAHLLPARNFSFGGWEINYHYVPLGAVSGDYGDLVRPDRTGDAMHFFFGDVSGKGVAASILMANLQALFRSLALQELPLTEMVGRANTIFTASTAPSSYATLVAGRLGPGGRLEIANAGHNPPLLVRSHEVSSLASADLPLGFAASGRHATRRFELEPGDFLFLYTDGVSETLDAAGREYSAERVRSALGGLRDRPARAVVESVLDDVNSFQNGTPRVDDVTAMAIRWRG